jgi:hypothetical protein
MWTPVAPGYWSNDVVIDGMVATGTRSGLDSHSAMGVTYRHFYVDGDLRGAEVPVGFACFGGTLEDGVLVNRAPAGHENIFLLGAEAYLNADTAFYSSSDSDLTLRNVKISYPNLSTSTGAFRFQATHGRKLSIQDCDLGIFQVAAADAPTDTPYIFRKVYVDGGHYQRIGVPNGSEAWVSDANLTSGIAGVSDNNDIGLHAYATAIHVRNCSFTGYKYATYMYGVGPLWMDGCTITGCTNASGNDGTVVQSVWTNCVIDGLTNWYDIDNAAMRMGQCVLTSGTPMPSNAKGEVLAKLAITDANTPAGATSKALPAYDANGILIGYVPVYSGKW